MFERYNINELYLGSVSVMYANNIWDTNIGGMLMASMAGYGYWTILKKIDEDKYIDLQDMRLVGTVRNPNRTSYTVDYIEPLGNYYTQDGKPKNTFSRRQAIKEATKHYGTVHKKFYAKLLEKQEKETTRER